jgi:copper chaperone
MEADMTTMTINVPEIHCDHCKTSLEAALAPIDGVADASVDVEAKTVTVSYDAASVDRLVLVKAIEDQGYDVPAQ